MPETWGRLSSRSITSSSASASDGGAAIKRAQIHSKPPSYCDCNRICLARMGQLGMSHLALPCHLWSGRAFLPRGGSRRRGAMDGSAAEGWEAELERWLEPFLARLRRKTQRYWAPFYVKG